MTESVDRARALQALNDAWVDISSEKRPPARMRMLIEQIMSASDVTYKYILVTGYLGKYVNPAVHARALQASSTLPGAYDARSLCHKVVVSFEKTKGDLFGLSNEPFVNKPARHPEHNGDNPQLKNRFLAARVHEALEIANSAPTRDTYLGLVHILRVAFQQEVSEIKSSLENQPNLSPTLEFIDRFLQEADGGARLVAVWASLIALISPEATISVTSPNVADKYGLRVGDVEIRHDETLVAASECKHRPLNLDDVKHGISKAIAKGVPEYHFVTAAGVAAGQATQIAEELARHSEELDLFLVDVWENKLLLSGLLNPIRRAKFGELVIHFLRQMRKRKSANIAVTLWNEITS